MIIAIGANSPQKQAGYFDNVVHSVQNLRLALFPAPSSSRHIQCATSFRAVATSFSAVGEVRSCREVRAPDRCGGVLRGAVEDRCVTHLRTIASYGTSIPSAPLKGRGGVDAWIRYPSLSLPLDSLTDSTSI